MSAIVLTCGTTRIQGDGASPLTIGRDPSSDIVLGDPMVSPRHAEVRLGSDGKWRIVDLGGRHGTHLGDARVGESVLRDGDEIRIGLDALHVQFATAPTKIEEITFHDDDGDLVRASSLRAETPSFPPAARVDGDGEVRRQYEKLRAVFELTRVIGVQRDVSCILSAVLDCALAALPAERGAMLLLDGAKGEPTIRITRTQGVRAPSPQAISLSVVRAAIARRAGLLTADAKSDPLFSRATSIFREEIRSVIAAPILVGEEAIGAIYLDTQSAAGAFRAEDLELLTAIASQAGMLITNSTLAIAIQDVTEKREEEGRRARQERLATVGQLAGGVAHDFNNALAVMLAHASFIAEETDGEIREDAATIVRTGTRAALLVRQLLDFSRQVPSASTLLDMNAMVREQAALWSRTLEENIRIEVETEAARPVVMADPTRIGQVIANLVLNARDAMPEGGCLRLATSELDVPGGQGLAPGRYLALEVSDDGTGMSPDVARRVFEPFFTTKQPGKGTGLGLASAFGIVADANGQIDVRSVEGEGSTFRVLLPIHDPKPDQVAERCAANDDERPLGGKETILLVEDDAAVLASGRRLLERAGYRVVGASNGRLALEELQLEQNRFDLVMTDVVMPELSGPAFVEAARSKGSDLPVLFVSGYVPDERSVQVRAHPNVGFLAKPFGEHELLGQVRRLLDF